MPLNLQRQIIFRPDSARVIIKPFVPSDSDRIAGIMNRAGNLTDEEVAQQLEIVRAEFTFRHFDIETLLEKQFEKVRSHLPLKGPISRARQLLIGALFSGEYAIESAALFNPSIVPHPDQTGLAQGELRFILSLRATGEGHISSVEFRSGVIAADNSVRVETISPFVALPDVVLNPSCNYELHFDKKLAVSERVLYPAVPEESNGIEDARFVRFKDDNAAAIYYATYTAYDGSAIFPRFLETPDFIHFRMHVLGGEGAQNKGMALFPRRIGGRFAMLSRQDDENLYLMFSDDILKWNSPQLLRRPVHPWEMIKIGNCGSPIETEEGWLVITHGVGPMRKYCIGALLLDIDDPSRVIGSLSEPLLKPEGSEREGYVPNVVYSCGSLRHGDTLIIAYAMSDIASVIATLDIKLLLAELLQSAELPRE